MVQRVLLLTLSAASAVTIDAAAPTATLDSGVVIGTTATIPSATAPVNKFLGIPFAQSPPTRFGVPVPPKPWTQPLTTTEHRPACLQQFNCTL